MTKLYSEDGGGLDTTRIPNSYKVNTANRVPISQSTYWHAALVEDLIFVSRCLEFSSLGPTS